MYSKNIFFFKLISSKIFLNCKKMKRYPFFKKKKEKMTTKK